MCLERPRHHDLLPASGHKRPGNFIAYSEPSKSTAHEYRNFWCRLRNGDGVAENCRLGHDDCVSEGIRLMSWFKQLDKHRGSRPRCVLLVDGDREEVAGRLTKLVSVPEVSISPSDRWMPYGKPVRENGSWDMTPAKEVILSQPSFLVETSIQRQLRAWWLAVPKRANAPNWDIASTCIVRNKPGLLLVEAKAHDNEQMGRADRCGSQHAGNREQIQSAINDAAAGLRLASGGSWNISRDSHYQLSNRFAWSWKLASLGIPVVLLYLGFLNARDVADRGQPFCSEAHWEQVLRSYGEGIVDDGCWGQWLDVDGVPLLPLIRGVDQPFGG